MAAKTALNNLYAGGQAATTATLAVVDLATCPPHLTGELRQRLDALVRHAATNYKAYPFKVFTATLSRLVYAAVGNLMVHARMPPDVIASDILVDHLREEGPATKTLATLALDCPNMDQFVARSHGDPVEMAVTGAAALRALLRAHVDGQDPLTRWTLLGHVTSTVLAQHYLG